MGLFNFGKKKKEQQLREQFKQKYRAMSLKELTSVMDELWNVSSEIEAEEIRVAYAMALFTAPRSEGGFGVPASQVNDEFYYYGFSGVQSWIKDKGVAYRYDEAGDIVAINRKLVFAGNYLSVDHKASMNTMSLVVSMIFTSDYIDNLSDEDILDEHHQIYNPWLGESSADPNDGVQFYRAKANAALILCSPEQCEEFGAFKRRNGVVTSEYATVDDLTKAKTLAQLNRLLDNLQTR